MIARPIAVAVLVLSLMTGMAQTRPAVHGAVTDQTGAGVPGMVVALQTVDGAAVTQDISGATGEFTLRGVVAGNYRVAVPAAHGFAAQQLPLQVSDAMVALKIVLSLEEVSQTVEVANEAPLSLDASDNKDTVVMTGDSLRRLPVFDQDFVGALTPFLDPGSISAGGVSLVVDGVEMKGSTVSPSAIAEVKVNTDPYSAEFSRPGRGRINIVTKPGSPEYHGTVNVIFRDAFFNASNYFAPVRPPEQRRIYEGDVTGPIGHGGHTTFLISGDRKEDDTAVAVHAFGLQGPIAANVQAPARDTQLTGRVAHDFSPAHRVSVGYNFEYGTRQNSLVGGLVLAEAGVNTDSREDDLILNDRMIFSPSLFNELQITFEKDEDVSRSVTDAPALQVQAAFVGGGAQTDVHRTENTVHINEVVSWTHKQHYVRFGANIPQISRRALDDHSNRLGTFGFNTLAEYASATPYVFTQQQGVGRGLYWINEIGGFVQDAIQMRKDLQVTVGVRYQWQTYINSVNNFAPRVSAAYSVKTGTVIRGGAGVFYDRTGGDFPGTFKVHNGVVLRSFQVLNPGYPSALPAGATTDALPTSVVRMDPKAHTPYSLQYSVAVERQLRPGLTLTVGYRGITGISNFRSRDANAPLGPKYTTRPDPSLAFVQQVESGGRLRSNALDVSLRGKLGRWFAGQAQYTLARVYNNTSGIIFYPQDQYLPNDEWGRADYDRLHRLNVLGNVNPEHWITLGVSATLYSGAPYTETAGSDVYGTGLGNARPAGVGRNTLQGGGTADVDLLWDHDFRLTKAKGEHAKILNLGVSGFNVLNHANFTNYVGSVGSPLFGQATAALPGRQMQLGVRYQF